jgi:hypothetical protein
MFKIYKVYVYGEGGDHEYNRSGKHKEHGSGADEDIYCHRWKYGLGVRVCGRPCRGQQHPGHHRLSRAARRVRAANGNAEVLPLDLSSQASIRAFVGVFRRGQFPPLAGIVCNAGMQNIGTPAKTEEGWIRDKAC